MVRYGFDGTGLWYEFGGMSAFFLKHGRRLHADAAHYFTIPCFQYKKGGKKLLRDHF